MKELKTFKDLALSSASLVKITGGTGGNDSNASEDGPTTDLGTVTNDGDA